VKATSKIAQLLFLVVALLGYTETTRGYYFYYGCTDQCIGIGVKAVTCDFYDADYLTSDSCYLDAEPFFRGLCDQFAAPDYFPWFAMWSCDDLTGDPVGQFYCSFNSEECL
jgi:hypothetical protein